MEAKHTAGPWRQANKHPRHICDRRGFKIAKCLLETKGANFVIPEEEALANARLIALAPEIKEALVRCDKAIQAWWKVEHGFLPETVEVVEAGRVAHDILAMLNARGDSE